MNIVYRIYQICIALPLLLLLTVLTAWVTMVGSCIGGTDIWGYYPGKVWSQLICFILFIPVKVIGREKTNKKTSYIFVANHQGAFDIFLIYGFLGHNFKWMMKKSLRKIPFVGKACESAGHIFVDRSGGPKAILDTVHQAGASLRNGISMVVFPEGSRSCTGRMGNFKKGAFQLADELRLAVVPVSINGSFDVFPRTSKWVNRHPMVMTIHSPILPKEKGIGNIKATMAEAYAVMESALPEKYRNSLNNDVTDMIEISDTTLRTAIKNSSEDFIQVITDKYWEIVGGDLKVETMPLLTGEQHSLLAYRIFRDEIMEGGFCQLIQNGYGKYIFGNPFAKAMRLFGAKDLSKLIYKAGQIYDVNREDLEQERTDEEFMAMYERYEAFDDLEEKYFEMEEEMTGLIATYVDSHLDTFVKIVP